MAIERQSIVYDGPGGPFEGVTAFDTDWDAPRPGVMIVPNVLGEKEQDRVVAERLAALSAFSLWCDRATSQRDILEQALLVEAREQVRHLAEREVHAA